MYAKFTDLIMRVTGTTVHRTMMRKVVTTEVIMRQTKFKFVTLEKSEFLVLKKNKCNCRFFFTSVIAWKTSVFIHDTNTFSARDWCNQ